MLNVLFVVDESHRFKEIEESLLSNFHVDYVNELKSNISEMSKLEFSYDIFFLFKEPSHNEIPTVNRLMKSKVLIYQTANLNSWITSNHDKIPVYDNESSVDEGIVLNSSNMVGKRRYYKNVEKIVAIKPFHVNLGWEVVLNGNKTTKAMIGDLAIRSGKDVILGQRNDNFVFFSCDVFSDDAVRLSNKHNIRFLFNLLDDLLSGVEIVE
ncbi:hypothetical protein DRP05_05450 [Archaeoglobales archaeon]|nr:MAG: hypothetical protein DRP05_05450 [Archaeoglobales archaeon]